MKKIVPILLLFAVAFKSFAQQQVPLDEKRYTDSLQAILKSTRADSSKANASFALVEYWKFKDTVKSKSYLEEGKKFSLHTPYYKALAYFFEGQYYFNWNHPKASVAFKKAEEALAKFQTPAAYAKRAAALYNYAIMNKDAKGYDFITRITLDKVIPIAEKTGNPATLAFYYTQLSTILMNNYQFAKARSYNQKAIELLEKGKPNTTNLLFAYLSGVSINCYDSQPGQAKVLLKKAQDLLKPFPGSLNYTLYYNNEALYNETIKDYNSALISVDKGIVLAKKYNQTQLYQQFLFRKYEILTQQKQYAKARQILLDIVKEGTLIANSNDRAAVFLELAKANENLKDYKEAYTWLNKSRTISDSISKSQTELKINELETKYRSAENQKKITLLQSQNKQTALIIKNERLYKWLLGSVCLLLVIILFVVILNARNIRKLAEQKEINHRQQLHEMEQREQLKVIKAMLDGEEHERERVARDLHDGLGGMLAGVKIGLSGWSNNQESVSQDKDLHRIIGQLDTSVAELRRIARNMVPESLLKFGLEVALKDLCEFHMSDRLHITFESFDLGKTIALNVQLNIYRIVQELISNAIKHAQASNIILQCSQNANTVFITFEDDGVGFDTAILANKKGMGIDNLRNRIAFLKGKFEIISAPGEGTIINIELNTIADE
ncbi:sensor histidine kinase [Mucilaginibacter sp. KACC 22063]|uniref:sensor histidine kinase n=1 Tax=Mucilaginibacter sp. KACC 22063 TaxID=3025666 RepID=UPI0023672B26|nr:sensor histidine kinase [Mucilaginibacter sp. KACC 22063]WDF55715.1 sensor histidine kinase [Mucilaginibacter sp. KACC 22063]